MIEISMTEVTGWAAAIRGARNPMNSHALSDTLWEASVAAYGVMIGEKDLALMSKLAKAGGDHGKFMRMIHVSCDVNAPLYWWKEADQYKIGTTTNSTSTMHKIHAKEFTLDDFSTDHMSGHAFTAMRCVIVPQLNEEREKFNETKDKSYWWNMIQLLPSSYNQKRTLDLNYAVLRNMYHARKSHKLDEWRTFCDWIESLPYAKELICGE